MTSVYGLENAPPAPAPDEPRGPTGLDHGLAMLGYFLTFLGAFSGGVTSVIAVILAYARKGDVDPVTHTHLRFQIRTFWWCLSLVVLAIVALVAAIGLGAWQFWTMDAAAPAAPPVVFDDPQLTRVQTLIESGVSKASSAVALLFGSGVLALWSVLWSWWAPIWGGLKLVFGKPIGRV